MSAPNPGDPSEAPTLEVKVYRDSSLTPELCNTVEEAAALVACWEETPGTECMVEDLSATTHDESSLEAEALLQNSGYPNVDDMT